MPIGIEFSNKWRIQWSLRSFLIPEVPNSALKENWLTQNWSQMRVLEKSQPDPSERAMARLNGPLWGGSKQATSYQLTFCVLPLLCKANYRNLKAWTTTSCLSFPESGTWVSLGQDRVAPVAQATTLGLCPDITYNVYFILCILISSKAFLWLDI